jgi:hypothetical protein
VTIAAEVRGRFHALQALAAALCALALMAFFALPNSFWFLLLGSFAIIVGMWLVRRSNAYVWWARGQVAAAQPPVKAAGPVVPVAWSLLAASLVGVGAFYRLTRLDALRWYKKAWPVDVFFGVVVVCLVAKVYLAKKLPR